MRHLLPEAWKGSPVTFNDTVQMDIIYVEDAAHELFAMLGIACG